MKRPPFDFCDDCGKKFPMEQLKGFLCRECRPPNGYWRPFTPPDDDYDSVTKRKDDDK